MTEKECVSLRPIRYMEYLKLQSFHFRGVSCLSPACFKLFCEVKLPIIRDHITKLRQPSVID